MSSGSGWLDRLVLRFRGLRITIEPADDPTETADSGEASESGARTSTGSLDWEVVSPEPAGEAPTSYFRLLTQSEEELLASEAPEAIGEFELGPLRHLASGLAAVGPWTPEGRVARAFRAGISAFLVVEGARLVQASSPPLALRNRFYICLRSRSQPEGFVTTSFRTFLLHCPREAGGRLDAFLEGARTQWPREL